MKLRKLIAIIRLFNFFEFACHEKWSAIEIIDHEKK